MIRTSSRGARSASTKNSLTFWAWTRGGRYCSVSIGSNRGECRLISSRAGCKRADAVGFIGAVGDRGDVRLGIGWR